MGSGWSQATLPPALSVSAPSMTRGHLPLGALRGVAKEFGTAKPLAKVEPDGLGGGISPDPLQARRAAAFCSAMAASNPSVSTCQPYPHEILCQVERKAIGVIELERCRAGKGSAAALAFDFLVQQTQATPKRLLEAGLLELQCLGDQGLGAAKLRVLRPHLGDKGGNQPVHHGILAAKLVKMAHRAAHDPAQHIAAPLV